MSIVGIVTDTSSSIPRDLVKEYGVYAIPVGFIINKKLYRDYVNITPEEFWKIFPTQQETPTTSAVSLGDFRQAFLDMSQKTNDIVCITLSKELSATHNAALQAANMIMEEKPGLNVKVIDSRTSAGALSLIVIEAARAAKAGKNMAEVIQVIQNMIPKVKYYMMLESIKYIARIGRAPEAKTQTSTPQPAMQISPILGIVKPDTGLIQNLNRAANLDEAIAKGIEMVKDYIDVSRPVHFLLLYPDNLMKCQQIQTALCEKYKCAEVHIGQFSPTTIIATGPMYSIAFWTD